MNILVPGGAGYIGSHTVRALQEAGHVPVVLDSLENGHAEAVRDVELIHGNILDNELVERVCRQFSIEAVMNFAAYIEVGESMNDPVKYYTNNTMAVLSLLKTVTECGIGYYVFSSTAAVYGQPDVIPIPEDAPTCPVNVYGHTKLMVEEALSWLAARGKISYAALRYFNACGAHYTGSIGEDHEPESHLIPLVLRVAQGRSEKISIFGDDYDTPDGTCVRDYVHVEDIASAHVKALEYLSRGQPSGAFNLGTGSGYSVRQVVEAARSVTGHSIPAVVLPRRAGDPAMLVASCERANRELGWTAERSSLENIMTTAWRWHSGHPNGFRSFVRKNRADRSGDDFFPYLGGKCDGAIEACPRDNADVLPDVKIYEDAALAALPSADVVAHAVRLQQLYKQARSDNKFHVWELHEIQENVAYFSRAAHLAHRLSVSDIDEIALLATTEIPGYFNCSFAALYLYDAPSRELRLFRGTEEASVPCPSVLHRDRDADHFLVTLFFSQQEPFVVEEHEARGIFVADNDAQLAVRIPEEWSPYLGTTALVMPLCVSASSDGEANMLGGLIIGGRGGEDKFESRDAEISTLFFDLLSSSLYNVRLLRQLNDLTIVDPLTGLFNRRHLIGQLSTAMIHSCRHSHRLSIAIVDVDHFKRVNDMYGHTIGDKALCALADLLKKTMRVDVDIPARYGGEEFVVIMPYSDERSAMTGAERLRARIEESEFDLGGISLSLTCSIGIAEYDKREDLERLIDRADNALYKAKHDGRNRVVAASSLKVP